VGCGEKVGSEVKLLRDKPDEPSPRPSQTRTQSKLAPQLQSRRLFTRF